MKSYIIRIYRCEIKHPDRLVGIVEGAGTKEKNGFKTLKDLGSILKGKRSKKEKGSKE